MADTEIELELGTAAQPGEYAVRVVRAASGGEPEGRLRLDVDDLANRRRRLEETVLASAARPRGVPEIEQPLRQTGQELFEALFSGPVAEVYRASLAVAGERGRRLRVVLRLTAPELSVLPWEALFDPVIEAYLCRKEPLVRHVPAPFSPEPLPVQPPLRILGLIASPRGLSMLDVETEQQHLQEALASSAAAGRVELEWLEQASWNGVHDRLLTGHWHVLHFIGHGDYDPATDEGQVALVGADGRADWVQASRLTDLLGAADPTPRLVVLNSCSSGQGGARDLFSGIAATLVRSGVSAVAAMQFSVSDRAAIAFPHGFYAAVAAGRGVEEAVRNGRIAILGMPGTLEWVTPVLYLRGNATQLFTLTSEPAQYVRLERQTTSPQDAKPQTTFSQEVTGDARWAEGLSAFFAGRYEEAVEPLEALQACYPAAAASLQTMLDQARRQRDLAAWFGEADTAAGHDDWASAVAGFERIVAIDGTYRHASVRLEQARIAQRRRSLVDEITALHRIGQWQGVLAVGEELAELDPSHPDPSGMLAHARRQLIEADLAARYSEGLGRLDGGQWQDAANLFAAIEQERRGYRDSSALLAAAQRYLQPETASRHEPKLSPSRPVRPAPATAAWTKPATQSHTPSTAAAEAPGDPVADVVVSIVSQMTGYAPELLDLDLELEADLGVGTVKQAEVFAAVRERCDVERDENLQPRDFPTLRDVVDWVRDKTGLQATAAARAGPMAALTTPAVGERTRSTLTPRTAPTYAPQPRTIKVGKPVWCLAFSPDGTRLATGSSRRVRIWDLRAGRQLWDVTLGGWFDIIFKVKLLEGLAFSSNGTRLATSDGARTQVRNAASGAELLTVRHTDYVLSVMNSVAFSPDGTRLATGSDDKTARITAVQTPPSLSLSH